ncbi:hypothetical protein D9M71_321760 [compost metagenome]
MGAGGAQAFGEGDQQLVAELVAVLLVDPLEVIQAQAQHRHGALQAAAVLENPLEAQLQQLAVGQTGEEVVLGNAQQAVFRLAAQVAVALDRLQQLVGGLHPQAQLVVLVAAQHGQLALAGMVRVDLRQVLDEARQRLGQQPVVDQEQHQAEGHGAEDAGDEDEHRGGDEIVAIGGRVEGDLQVAVVLVGIVAAGQRDRVAHLGAEDRIGQPAARRLQQRARAFGEHGFVGLADGGVAHRLMLEQAFQHLHGHVAVEAVDRLGRWVAEHRQDVLGFALRHVPRRVGVEGDLGAAEHHSDRKGGEQHDTQELERKAVPGGQFQGGHPCSTPGANNRSEDASLVRCASAMGGEHALSGLGSLCPERFSSISNRLGRVKGTSAFFRRFASWAVGVMACSGGKKETRLVWPGFRCALGSYQAAKFFATKSQFTRFQNASTYFGRRLR